MIPIVLVPAHLRLGLAGDGPAAARRARRLVEAGATPIPVSADPALLPKLDVLWIADLAEPDAVALATVARARKILVNVEDRPDWCDFHNAAELRRGGLLIAVSTGGESPGLAGAIRDRIGALFGRAWAGRVAELGVSRRTWRAEGRSLPELARLTAQAIEAAGWLA